MKSISVPRIETDASARQERGFFEPGRGVYDAQRASALAGIPRSTLHRWARTGFYQPSISPGPRPRLWSWADLLTLRAIDWFRKRKGDEEVRKVSYAQLHNALQELVHNGLSPQDFYRIVAVIPRSGDLMLTLQVGDVRANAGRQMAFPDVLSLVKPYQHGPDLLKPRPLLRIVPGKLHGEPHVLYTRISSAVLYNLYKQGYTIEMIARVYPEAGAEGLQQAIDLETSLQPDQCISCLIRISPSKRRLLRGHRRSSYRD